MKKAPSISDVIMSDKVGEENKIYLLLENGDVKKRSFYELKKKNILYFIYDYRYYKIVNPFADASFQLITEKERKRYGIDANKATKKKVVAKVNKEKTKVEIVKPDIEKLGYDPNAIHKEYEYIKLLVEQNIPAYLVGPAGTGKTFICKKVADDFGLDFYFINCVQDVYRLTGFIDAHGKYQETEFYKAIKYGGLFFIDELDASVPEVLNSINTMLANGYFAFPTGIVYAHENFRVIAAGNTLGHGADEMYTGRMTLDLATLDRFLPVPFYYDKDVELAITKGNKELVDFVHECRRIAETSGMRMVFTYRCLEMVTKLEGSDVPLTKIIHTAVFKSMPVDDLNMFRDTMWLDNKYSRTLRELQRA